MTDPAGASHRLDHLDALRGVAAVAVMWYHYVHGQARDFGAVGNLAVVALTDVVDAGKVAVVLFFAISGFIIPNSLSSQHARPVRHFVVGRFFRLYPAYWLSIALCVLFFETSRVPAERDILLNLTMVQGFLGVRDINGVAWTLLIELVFYAVCLAMHLAGVLGSRRAQFLAFLAALGLALLLAGLRYALVRKFPVAMPLGIAVMFLGTLWRGVVLERDPAARGYAGRALLLLVAVLPPICVLAYSADFGFGETWPRYLVAYAVAVGAFLLFTSRLRLRSRALAYLGTISYSVYLLHTPMAAALSRLGLFPTEGLTPAAQWLVVGAAMAAVVALSALSHRFVERPAIAFGRHLSELRGLRANPAPSSAD